MPIWTRRKPQSESSPEIFSSWDEAQRHCVDGGFKSDLRARSMYERAKAYYGGGRFPAVPWYLTAGFCPALLIAAESKSEIHVLDFGGMAGNLYYLALELLPGRAIKWAVVETEALVKIADQGRNLRFFTLIDAAADWLGRVDLMHSSGAIQCVPDL